jgi:hypothetical protein
MNAGFSNLFTLKANLLAEANAAGTDYDAVITALGLGVAGQFQKICNRGFGRVVGQQEVFGADRVEFLLSSYPVEPPITLVEYKADEPTGWVEQNQSNSPDNVDNLIIKSLDAANGIISFDDDQDCGPYWAQMRFTYTSGYFWEQLEPNDPAYPTMMPATATPLPDSLQLAWLLQCRNIWNTMDKLGLTLVEKEAKLNRKFVEPFAPTVMETLASFVRYTFV